MKGDFENGIRCDEGDDDYWDHLNACSLISYLEDQLLVAIQLDSLTFFSTSSHDWTFLHLNKENIKTLELQNCLNERNNNILSLIVYYSHLLSFLLIIVKNKFSNKQIEFC